MDNDKFLGAAATARQIGVSTDTLGRMRREQRGPAYFMIGRRVKYTQRDIDTYLRGQRVSPNMFPSDGGDAA